MIEQILGEVDDAIASLFKIRLIGRNGGSFCKLKECGLIIYICGWAEM